MRIEDIRFNGLKNAIGLSGEPFGLSFNVTDTESKSYESCTIEVMEDDSKLVIDGSPIRENIINFSMNRRTLYHCKIAVIGDNGDKAEESTSFETGKMDEPWQAKWIGCRPDCHPMFSKRFSLDSKVIKARLYICGMGLFKASINGLPVGNDVLSPGISDFREELEYKTYDVTDYLTDENNIEVILGKGWYMGRYGLAGGKENNFGESFQLICELHVDLDDGSHVIIPSDASWSCESSSILDSGIYLGEIVDETKKGKSLDYSIIEEKRRLVGYTGSSAAEVQFIAPIGIETDSNNDIIIDFGQNMAGHVQFRSIFEKGKKLELDFAETLKDGAFYNGNYRTAEARFVYTSDGIQRLVKPLFTYYGFRYCRVRGATLEGVRAMDVKAVCISADLTRTGFFSCGNEKVNRLYENAFWSQLSNFIDLPTDCPQRDERLGWTGDAQVFCPTACYNMDTRPFYTRFLKHLRKDQIRNGGGIGNYIPKLDFLSGFSQVWGDAGTFIPDTLSLFYANRHEYHNEFEMMSDWIHWCVDNMVDSAGLVRGHMQFGDWLALDGSTEQSFKGGTDDDFVASVYFYASTLKTVEMAERLGCYSSEFKMIAERSRKAILDEYFSKTGRLCIDTQTGYIIALRFNIYVDRDKIIEGLKRRLQNDCYRIKCGFVGAPVMLQVLSDNGMGEIAMKMLLNEDRPGWLHCVNLGATTIWERWNSIGEDGNIAENGMNSLNHYAFGNVVQFLYENLAGIKPIESGFAKVRIKPIIDARIGEVHCLYKSVAGIYQVDWNINDDGSATVVVNIPFGCCAVVELEGYNDISVSAGRHVFSIHAGQDLRCIYNGESFLKELVDNPNTRTILEKGCPQLLAMAKGEEERTLTLNRIKSMPFLGIEASVCDDLISAISQVKCC